MNLADLGPKVRFHFQMCSFSLSHDESLTFPGFVLKVGMFFVQPLKLGSCRILRLEFYEIFQDILSRAAASARPRHVRPLGIAN